MTLLNTDAHSPSDFLTIEQAFEIARAAGLHKKEADRVISKNPLTLIDRIF